MGPESREVVIPPFEPPKEFILENHSYVDAVVGRLSGDPEKSTPEHVRSSIEKMVEQGRIDDRLSPGGNITSLLKASEKVGITFSPFDQWKFYQDGHMKAAELLSQQAFTDVDGRDYYHEEAQKAQRKSLEIQALLEQHGNDVHEENITPAEVLDEQKIEEVEKEIHPEDEFVDAVEAVAIKGIFPRGLMLNGKLLVRPGPKRGFDIYSDSDFTLSQNRYITAAVAMFSQQQEPRLDIPHAVAILPYTPTKHELSTDEFASSHKEGNSILVYFTRLDGSTRDEVGRGLHSADTYFLMPTEKATEFIDLIQQEPNGADIFESFVQKAAPGAMAPDRRSPGVNRKLSEQLLVLDDSLRKEIIPDEVLYEAANTFTKVDKLLKNLHRIPIKKYSHSVGTLA